jgi:transposase
MMLGVKTTSLDLRERILTCYDGGEGTREQIAKRFCVSLGMIKKLLLQRRQTGDIAPRHHLSGRKPKILASHRQALRSHLAKKPDMTLEELRLELKLECSLTAIHYILDELGLTYKKRLSMRASRTVPTSGKPAKGGGAAKAGSIRPGSSSSTNRPPRRT